MLILLAFPVQGSAQESESFAQTASSRLTLSQKLGLGNVNMDSAGTVGPQVSDSANTMQHPKSALAAVLFSIIPGGGQIYNGSYWKAPIVWGVQAYFVYEWIANNKIYRSYQQELSDSIAAGAPSTSYDPAVLSVSDLIGLRNAAQSERDGYAWYIAGAYILSMLDAYVDAELSGFNVSPKLGTTPSGKTFALSFRMSF